MSPSVVSCNVTKTTDYGLRTTDNAITTMIPPELKDAVVAWGPGVVILLLFGYGLMKLAHYWVEKTMEFRRYQMESALGITRQYIEQFLNSQKSQAEALSRLAGSVEQRETRDSFEHQEILIALKAIHRDMETQFRTGEESSA